MGVLVIPEGRTFLFRTAIFIGLGTVVTTIIYLTPVPDQYPQPCSRPCHELDWPMICRVKLTFERYQTLGSACKDCRSNATNCYHENCITVDGHSKGILAANRQFPGPTIQVCQHDIIVVDIVNRIPGQSFGVHWRGQPQSETPYMDGVPMVTQCPIPSLTTFQYKFRASESGTHLWQVNTGEENLDSLFGPLIVRKPNSKEMHSNLYDTDDVDNIVLIHPWSSRKTNFLFQDDISPMKLLINGKTQENGMPPFVFRVDLGKRHRFRVAYTGGVRNCQIRFSIDSHQLLVIALDGHSIRPKMVTSINLFPGERFDFVLLADQKTASYRMRATPIETCTVLIPTSAIVQYNGALDVATDDSYNNDASTLVSELKTSYDEVCTSKTEKLSNICLTDVQAAESISNKLLVDKPDVKLNFFYDWAVVSNQNVQNTSFIALDETVTVPQANNLTMMLPSSPLLSQSHQIRSEDICRNGSIPERCKENKICECVHVVNIPLNAMVELVLVNQDKTDHVFHLHGYSFLIMGASKLPSPHLKPEKIKYLDETNQLVKRNFDFPVVKDTVAVINNSAVVLRFMADNPGYWLLDEEQASYWSRGMSLVLHVGKKSDLSPIPKNFPKCGDWIGPEFFLV